MDTPHCDEMAKGRPLWSQVAFARNRPQSEPHGSAVKVRGFDPCRAHRHQTLLASSPIRYLELLSRPSQGLEADEGTAEGVEGGRGCPPALGSGWPAGGFWASRAGYAPPLGGDALGARSTLRPSRHLDLNQRRVSPRRQRGCRGACLHAAWPGVSAAADSAA